MSTRPDGVLPASPASAVGGKPPGTPKASAIRLALSPTSTLCFAQAIRSGCGEQRPRRRRPSGCALSKYPSRRTGSALGAHLRLCAHPAAVPTPSGGKQQQAGGGHRPVQVLAPALPRGTTLCTAATAADLQSWTRGEVAKGPWPLPPAVPLSSLGQQRAASRRSLRLPRAHTQCSSSRITSRLQWGLLPGWPRGRTPRSLSAQGRRVKPKQGPQAALQAWVVCVRAQGQTQRA